MHQLKDKKNFKFVILIPFFLFLTTFNTNNFNDFNFFFKIKNVFFNKTLYLEEPVKSEIINFLNNKSLIFFNEIQVQEMFQQSNWVKKIEFKRRFPADLVITINEFYPVAYYEKDNKIYIVNSGFLKPSVNKNINLNNLIKINNNLDLNKLRFFYNTVKNYNFLLNEIIQINFVRDNRWDVVLKDQKLIKFGTYDLPEQINQLRSLIIKHDAHTIDFRIKNRITITYVK